MITYLVFGLAFCLAFYWFEYWKVMQLIKDHNNTPILVQIHGKIGEEHLVIHWDYMLPRMITILVLTIIAGKIFIG